jgi:hypothetical protein
MRRPASVSPVVTCFTKPVASKRYPKSALVNSLSTRRHALRHVVSRGPLQMGGSAHHVWFPRLPWMQARHESPDAFQRPSPLHRASGRHPHQGCFFVVCPRCMSSRVKCFLSGAPACSRGVWRQHSRACSRYAIFLWMIHLDVISSV